MQLFSICADTPHILYSPRKGFRVSGNDPFTTSAMACFERSWNCPCTIGAGRITRIEIRSGFDIWITECRFHRNVLFSLEEHPSALSFSFCLSGNSRSVCGSKKENIEMSGGQQGVFYFPDPNGIGQMAMNVPVMQVGIVISPERLLSYFEEDPELIPALLGKALTQSGDESFLDIRNITPAMHTALSQMLHCPFRGVSRKIFLESRALELISRQLEQISPSENSSGASGHIHRKDLDRAVIARDLLLKDIENPPSLKELARAAGMSHPKLNRCFFENFGMTVFQYLRDERLNRARNMLMDGGLSVTETAYSVGYSSLSHFAKAYKRQFGVAPGDSIRTA